jgi:hypothetical protein
VDRQGHVYISGRNSNDIHRLSPDGTFRDIILNKHDGVDWPYGITFSNDFTKLFIINDGGEAVLVNMKILQLQNMKILQLQNIKILQLQNIRILQLQNIEILQLQNIEILNLTNYQNSSTTKYYSCS